MENCPKVLMETTHGIMELMLKPHVAPKAYENSSTLANKGYYDGTVFHRIIRGFMIQGRDPTGTGASGESIWKAPSHDFWGGYFWI